MTVPEGKRQGRKSVPPLVETLDQVAEVVCSEAGWSFSGFDETSKNRYRRYAAGAIKAVLAMQRYGLVPLDSGADVIRPVEGKSRDTFISVQQLLAMLGEYA